MTDIETAASKESIYELKFTTSFAPLYYMISRYFFHLIQDRKSITMYIILESEITIISSSSCTYQVLIKHINYD